MYPYSDCPVPSLSHTNTQGSRRRWERAGEGLHPQTYETPNFPTPGRERRAALPFTSSLPPGTAPSGARSSASRREPGQSGGCRRALKQPSGISPEPPHSPELELCPDTHPAHRTRTHTHTRSQPGTDTGKAGRWDEGWGRNPRAALGAFPTHRARDPGAQHRASAALTSALPLPDPESQRGANRPHLLCRLPLPLWQSRFCYSPLSAKQFVPRAGGRRRGWGRCH